VPVLLTTFAVTHRFGAYGGMVLCLDRVWPAIRRKETANPACRAQSGDRDYVMYTSGSAGWPEGVEIIHPRRRERRSCHARQDRHGCQRRGGIGQ